MQARKLNILCLHGFMQHATSFKNKTNSLRKALKSHANFHYISAPVVINKDEKDPKKQFYAWFDSIGTHIPNSNERTYFYKGVKDTIKHVSSAISDYGPFDGILGFSQGGVLATLICAINGNPKQFMEALDMGVFSSFTPCTVQYPPQPHMERTVHRTL